EDHRRVRAGLPHGRVERVVDRHALHVLTRLAGRDPGHEVGAVAPVVQPVEAALAAREARHDQLRVGADEDAHRGCVPSPPASAGAASVPETTAAEAVSVPAGAPPFDGASPASSTTRAAAPSIVFSTCTFGRL